MKSTWKQKTRFIFLIYCLLALTLRFFSFFPSAIDHDESTYLEIARMILEGRLLYIDMTDIKPPGIFLIMAGIQAVFGYPVFVIRLCVSIWIALTAFLIFKSGLMLFNDRKASFAAGLIYLFLISTWSFYGISISPEIFFNLFTVLSFYILLKRQTPLAFLLAGLVAGAGFMVKYFVIFDFTAFILFFGYLKIKEAKRNFIPGLLSCLLLAGLGFVIPFALTAFYYFQTGHYDVFHDIVFSAPGRYADSFRPWKMLVFILDFQLRFLPVFLIFYYIILKRNLTRELKPARVLLIFWSLLALTAVVITDKRFGHYTIQLMLPVSFMAGLFFHSLILTPVSGKKWLSGSAAKIAFYLLILIVSLMKIEYVLKKDIPREIAAYLEPRLQKEEAIYTGNYHHIIYYLLKKDSPTPYIHRSLLYSPVHIRALNIDADEEFRKIMAKEPVYILVEKDYPEGLMKDFIEDNYALEKEFEGNVRIYRLRNN